MELYSFITILLDLVIAHLFIFIEIFISSYCWVIISFFVCLLYFPFRTPLNLSCSADLVAMNSFSFDFSENVLISPSLLKRVCQKNHSWLTDSFLFRTLNVSANCLLSSKVYEDKSAGNFFEDPLYVMSFIYPSTLRSSSSFQRFIYMKSWYVPF